MLLRENERALPSERRDSGDDTTLKMQSESCLFPSCFLLKNKTKTTIWSRLSVVNKAYDTRMYWMHQKQGAGDKMRKNPTPSGVYRQPVLTSHHHALRLSLKGSLHSVWGMKSQNNSLLFMSTSWQFEAILNEAVVFVSYSDPDDRGCFSDIRLMVQGFEGNKDTSPRWFINPFESLLNPLFPLTVLMPPSTCTAILGGKPTARSPEQLELQITRSRENVKLTLETAYDVSTAMNKVVSYIIEVVLPKSFAFSQNWVR